jgi:hypothetical protein
MCPDLGNITPTSYTPFSFLTRVEHMMLSSNGLEQTFPHRHSSGKQVLGAGKGSGHGDELALPRWDLGG